MVDFDDALKISKRTKEGGVCAFLRSGIDPVGEDGPMRLSFGIAVK